MNTHQQFPIVITPEQRAEREAADRARLLDNLANLQASIGDLTRLAKSTSYIFDAPEYTGFLHAIYAITEIDAVYEAASEITAECDPDEAYLAEADYRYDVARDEAMMREAGL
jgi:hypothetical protein